MTINVMDLGEPEPIDIVWELLNPAHCDRCRHWSEKQSAWWTDPYEVEGQAEIREIIRHYEGSTHAT